MSQPEQAPPSGNWRDQRRNERHARRDARRASWNGWAGPSLGGIILILLGVGLLLQNIGYNLPARWWALLLLLPAAGSFAAAIRSYGMRGASPDSVGALAGGAIFTALALALFFGVNWGIFWPVVIVLLGATILLRSYWPR